LTDQPNAAPAAGEAAPVVSAPNLDSGESFTAEQAFEAYQKRNSPAESAPDATADNESAQADAAPEGTTAEDNEAEPDVPAIDPPKSWSKDAHERWAKLDRETQEYLATRDSEDQKAIKRALNEAADERKAVKAEREAAEQEKKTYQAKLPALMQALHDVSDREFPDIKSVADYERFAMEAHRLSTEDPFKALQIGNYLKAFDAHQQRVVAVNNELQRAEGEKRSATQAELDAYKNEHDRQLLEFAPELADPKTKAEVTDKAIKALVDDLGMKRSELDSFASDPAAARLLFHSVFQKLLYNHLKFSDLKAAPAKAIPKPVPAVQKPGVARAPGNASADAIQATRNKLNSTGSAEDAYALYQAKKARAR
jgi:hypothetical protein